MNWWYFGYAAGLNFNDLQVVNATYTGIPTVLPKAVGGQISTREGSFTLSDDQGKLLMYSDGVRIVNKKHVLMTNGTGLFGGESSTQSAIVIPAPNNPTKFYIVTAAQELGAAGIQYDEVDLDPDDPNDFGTKKLRIAGSNINKLTKGGNYENILAVLHANEVDYWLIHRTGSVYSVFLLTEDGFVVPPKNYQTPVLSTVSPAHLGESIISPDHRKLVGFTYYGGEIISSNFNTTTGVISEIQVLKVLGLPYGGSFSPNGEYLYYSDISAPNYSSAIKIKYNDLRSATVVPTKLNVPMGNIRMGPDKKLYGIHYDTRHLYVIMDPDMGATDIRFFSNYLVGKVGYGLPSFGGLNFLGRREKRFSCNGYNTDLAIEFSKDDIAVSNKLVWDFGDGSATEEQLPIAGTTVYKKSHFYKNPGSYQVTVTPFINGTVALTPISCAVWVTDCTIKSNRTIRHSFLSNEEVGIKQ